MKNDVWALLPDGSSLREVGTDARDAWEGRATPAENGNGWIWGVYWHSPYVIGMASGWSRTRLGAQGQATRFARAALEAL